LIVEGHFATHENIENDAETPDIDLWAGIDFRVEKLGCGKVERAAERSEVVDGVEQIRQAEIDELDVSSLGNKDILDFQV
jgi:hypothetical protein